MFTARTAPGGRVRRLLAAATATALGTTALVAVAAGPAAAAPLEKVTEGSFSWGFKQSFRSYVANFGGQITPSAPAVFEPAEGDAKRPYAFPASAGVLDVAAPSLSTQGGVRFSLPVHYFEVELDDVRLAQVDGDTVVVADIRTTSTQAFGTYPEGEFGGEDVVLADVAELDVVRTADGATITGTGLTLTEEGEEAFPLYHAGDELDDFTATVTFAAGAVTVSQTELPSDGTTVVTVEGTGFDPALNIASRPPFAGHAAGVYVAFGRYDDEWRPSTGAASSARRNPSGEHGNGAAVVWAVPAESFAHSSPAQSLDTPMYTELREDGTFTASVQVNREWLADAAGNFGIYTYAGGGGVVASYETYTPVTFYDRVTVSTTELPDDLTSVVTVKGRGFDPSLNTGTRPPFAGRPAGLYVAFGRYADVWRPSEGAPSSARTNPSGEHGNGAGIVWAVPAASFDGSGQSLEDAAYTELREDGTFTATLKVDRSWLADAEGNFGIYTYAGGGGKVAAYETYTPISFYERGKATVAPTWPTLSYGTTSTLWVKVTGATQPTGKVTLSEGSKVLASGTLSSSGKVKLSVPRTLAVGKHTLKLSYAGDTRSKPASVSSTRTVAKAASTTKVTAAKVKSTVKGKVVVTVTAAAKVTGTAKVVVKRNGSTKAAATATLVNGKRTFTLPKLPKGTYTVTVTYNGSATVAKSTKNASLVVY